MLKYELAQKDKSIPRENVPSFKGHPVLFLRFCCRMSRKVISAVNPEMDDATAKEGLKTYPLMVSLADFYRDFRRISTLK